MTQENPKTNWDKIQSYLSALKTNLPTGFKLFTHSYIEIFNAKENLKMETNPGYIPKRFNVDNCQLTPSLRDKWNSCSAKVKKVFNKQAKIQRQITLDARTSKYRKKLDELRRGNPSWSNRNTSPLRHCIGLPLPNKLYDEKKETATSSKFWFLVEKRDKVKEYEEDPEMLEKSFSEKWINLSPTTKKKYERRAELENKQYDAYLKRNATTPTRGRPKRPSSSNPGQTPSSGSWKTNASFSRRSSGSQPSSQSSHRSSQESRQGRPIAAESALQSSSQSSNHSHSSHHSSAQIEHRNVSSIINPPSSCPGLGRPDSSQSSQKSSQESGRERPSPAERSITSSYASINSSPLGSHHSRPSLIPIFSSPASSLFEVDNNWENDDAVCNSKKEHPKKREDIPIEVLVQRWETIREKVKARGFTIKEEKGDGSCLFRAFSEQLYEGKQNSHAEIRQNCMDHIVANRDFFSSFISEDFDEYVKDRRKHSTYGDHVEIQSICQFYVCRAVVINYNTDDDIVIDPYPERSDLTTVRLSYDGVHYNSVIAGKDESIQPQPIITHQPSIITQEDSTGRTSPASTIVRTGVKRRIAASSKMPAWNPPRKATEIASGSPPVKKQRITQSNQSTIVNRSSILRLGLSRKSPAKPLHPEFKPKQM